MITPSYLKPGDKIAIVATARKVSPSEMDVAISTFRSWGLQVATGLHLFGVNNQYSGTDEERISDLQMMLDDTNIKAIICARGGMELSELWISLISMLLSNIPSGLWVTAILRCCIRIFKHSVV